MTKAVVIRIGQALLSMLALTILVFAMARVTGDPSYFLTGPEATEEDRQRMREDLGLDKPLLVQYGTYLGNVLQGDLGDSFRSRVPVSELITQRVPATLTMGAAAFILTIGVAVPLGLYSGYRPGSFIDAIARGIAALGQSMPSFWLGLLLILFFSVNLGVLPSGGYGGLDHLLLPSLTLSFGAIAGLTRLLRSSMIEELGSDHVTFHRTKGLRERSILWKHALRNAGLTSLSYVGIITAGLFTGSVLVETVFVWPGIGRLMIEAIEFRDFNVIQGVMLVFAATYIGVNLLVDLLYVVLNPRLRT